MTVFRFSAALAQALPREALRQAAASIHAIELVVASSTARSAAGRAGKHPLDAIVIDMDIPDAAEVLAELSVGADKNKLLVVSHDPRAIAQRYSLRSSQVIPASNDAEDQASILVERLMSLVPKDRAATPTKAPTLDRTPSSFKRREIVVLGCSTGGPEALAVVLGALPARFPVPIVVVQHMPPDFTRLLADRLDKTCALSVNEVVGPVKAKPGEVWIAPGHSHIKLTNTAGQIELDDGPEENNCKPAVDVLFRSAAATYGRRAVGVILTGMGDDGARGGKLLADSNAHIIAQDEVTSVVWGMPGAAFRAGIVDSLVPLQGVANEISQQFRAAPVGASA